jgi:hypothetical protein
MLIAIDKLILFSLVGQLDEEERRELLESLLGNLPGFPCGYSESEIIHSPTLGGTFIMTEGFGPLNDEEALGIAADLIRSAFELQGRSSAPAPMIAQEGRCICGNHDHVDGGCLCGARLGKR